MNVLNATRCLLLAGLLVTPASRTALADELPQQIHKGEVTYMTGGVGDDERAAMESEREKYNLRIMNADKSGAMTTDDQLTIRSTDGKVVIEEESTDPLFYAKLPPGRYSVKAVNAGKTQQRKVDLSGKKSAYVTFIW